MEEKENKKISFIIPCYGSEKTVGIVIDEIDKKVKERKEYDYEVVAVNDQSPDNVWNVLKDIAKEKKCKINTKTKTKNLKLFHYQNGMSITTSRPLVH